MKIVFPIIWISGFTTGTVILFFFASDPNIAFLRWIFLFITAVGVPGIWWSCMRLKRVRMDDRALYVSNYKTEIIVPLSNVAEVTENRWINIHPVTIKFYSETGFGSQIVFMPKARPFGLWFSHPVVGEIRSAVARATGQNPVI
ncbi:MAG TPA: hypothetical protein VNW97_09050 [Candidatus Saccharimonadales bacterium]|nr:hypothetical protein [Candidatus Saccharimonadales bacterium]